VSGAVWPGVLLVLAWAASTVIAVRHRVRPLIALDVVLAGALALGLFSIASIFGFVWYYLMRWAWGINALMLFTIGWAVVVQRAQPIRRTARTPRLVGIGLAAVTAVYLLGFAVDGGSAEPPTPRVSTALGRLVRPTVRAIDAGSVPGGGRSGRYQVTFVDPVTINAPGYGLLSELERSGIHAGLSPVYAAIVRDQRVVTKSEATGVVHLSVGPDIARWNRKAGAKRVATVDLRTPAERREFDRLKSEVRAELIAADHPSLVRNLDENIFTATFVTDIPVRTQRKLKRMLDIGEPSAIFVGPGTLADA
jgi:hypothetical protein